MKNGIKVIIVHAFCFLQIQTAFADDNAGNHLNEVIIAERNSYTPAQKKVDSHLLKFKKEIKAKIEAGQSKAVIAKSLSTQTTKVDGNGNIQVYVEFIGNAGKETENAIKFAGGKVELLSKEMSVVQAWVPNDKIEEIAKKEFVRNIRRPGYALNQSGSINSEGDAIHKTNLVRTTFGYNGTGIKVGIISDGISGISTSQASGDIPTTYQAVSARADNNLMVGSEGTAMMEIVHDLAPGAALAFSNPNTSAEFINAINILDTTLNSNIICDDLLYTDEPFFEDGPIALRANQINSSGKLAISAAGNYGNGNFYEADFQAIPGFSMLHNFNGINDATMKITVAPNKTVQIVLQWNDKYGQSGNDYNLLLTNSYATYEWGHSYNNQNGSDNPFESVEFTNYLNDDFDVYLWIVKNSGISKRLKLFVSGGGTFEHPNTSGSIWGHPSATGVIAVGAINQGTPTTIASYSSQGPVRIDFPSLTSRQKPDICGIDAVSVTGNGGFSTPFAGTSAAAPHIAAVMAQIWSAKPTLTNTQVKNFVLNNAVDLGVAGFDNVYGYGRADALAAATAVDVSAPTFSSISAIPAAVVQGNSTTITFTTSETLVSNPTVTINGHTATYSGLSGNVYTYTYTTQASDSGGAATIAIVGTDLLTNTGTASNTSALSILPTTTASITPTKGGNTGIIHITNLAGTNFISGMNVTLTKTGETSIAGTNVSVISPNQISCDFPLTGKTAGLWNVVVTLGTVTITLSNGFAVTSKTFDQVSVPSGSGTTFTINPAPGTVQVDWPSGTLNQNITMIVQTPQSYQSLPAVSRYLGTGVGVDLAPSVKNLIFNKSYTLTIGYRHADVPNINKEDKLIIAYYNEIANQWVPEASSVVDMTANTVAATINHCSVFQILQIIAENDLSLAEVYPNPFKPNHSTITFDKLSNGSKIKIYTISGNLVNELEQPVGGSISWNARNNDGEEVASGIYLYRITDTQGNKATGKLAVIR